ncbi:MAG: hypothetical protein HZA49_02250 [Planctomycetes bacterium]|nr:hypothetical protein [Planctomycetota bacterium]
MKYLNNKVTPAIGAEAPWRPNGTHRRDIRASNAPPSLTGSNDGTVMVLVMIITAIIAGLGVAYITTTTAQQEMVHSSIDNIGYEEAAFSGFEIAKAYLISKYSSGWDTQLGNSNTYSGTYTANSASIQNGASITYTTNYTTWFQWCRNVDYYGNTYFAKIENNNDGGGATNDTDGILKLTVEAWGNGNNPDNRSQQILLEGMVNYTAEMIPYEPTSALVVGGSLEMTGNPTITGTMGSVQSNGSVTVTGSSYINGDVTAVGSVSAPPGTVNGSSNPNSEETNIPPINPPDYKYLANYIFKSDGNVYDASNNPIATPAGWAYTAGTPVTSTASGVWKKTGNTKNDGVFYFEDTAVDVSSSPGSAADPWLVTMIATGYIDVSGSPSISPNPAGGGIGLLTGEDLKMRGSGGSVYGTGLYAAHEQVSLVGTPKIIGTVLAEDAIDTCQKVSSVNNIDLFGTITEIAGNTLLTYNGDLITVLQTIDGHPYIKVLGFKKRIKARY